MDRLDAFYIALIGFFITFISVAGKIVSMDLHPDKSIQAKLFIIFSRAILGFILAYLVIKGTPIFYPKFADVSIYLAWLICYFAVDLVPLILEFFKNKTGGKL